MSARPRPASRFAAVLAAVVVAALAPTGAGAGGDITLFDADPAIKPLSIVTGPDGNLWFTSKAGNEIGRMTPAGVVTTFGDATVNAPHDIVAGPDGNLWFTSSGNDRLGRITPSGTITTFEDSLGMVDAPQGIVLGVDGYLWFTSYNSDRIGRITTGGAITTWPGYGIDEPKDIAVDGAGDLWVTSFGTGEVVRYEPGVGLTEVVDGGAAFNATDITGGPDGNVWFTSDGTNEIGRITPEDGDLVAFSDPDVVGPRGIAPGPDGNLWFTTGDLDPDRVGRITTAGWITTWPDDELDEGGGTTAGPDGYVWFTSTDGDQVGRVSACLPEQFSDVAASHPFFEEVCWMAEHGISTGYGDGTYKPGAAVSRQAMSAFMFRLAGATLAEPPEGPSFSDVPVSHPFFDEIEWMAAEGISTGYGDGTYKPSAAVSRQAMSAFMQRVAPLLPVPL